MKIIQFIDSFQLVKMITKSSIRRPRHTLKKKRPTKNSKCFSKDCPRTCLIHYHEKRRRQRSLSTSSSESFSSLLSASSSEERDRYETTYEANLKFEPINIERSSGVTDQELLQRSKDICIYLLKRKVYSRNLQVPNLEAALNTLTSDQLKNTYQLLENALELFVCKNCYNITNSPLFGLSGIVHSCHNYCGRCTLTALTNKRCYCFREIDRSIRLFEKVSLNTLLCMISLILIYLFIFF